jgi:hypothetical protein
MVHQDDENVCPACGNIWNADEMIEYRNEEILQLRGMVASLRQSLELVQSRFVNEDEL